MNIYILPDDKAYLKMKSEDMMRAYFVGYWNGDKFMVCKDILTGKSGISVPVIKVTDYLESYS